MNCHALYRYIDIIPVLVPVPVPDHECTMSLSPCPWLPVPVRPVPVLVPVPVRLSATSKIAWLYVPHSVAPGPALKEGITMVLWSDGFNITWIENYISTKSLFLLSRCDRLGCTFHIIYITKEKGIIHKSLQHDICHRFCSCITLCPRSLVQCP